MMRQRLLLTFLAVATAIGIAAPAQSQQWPQRPVRIVVPYPPGGLTDGIARLVGQRLGESFGQPFVIENMGGGGGAIAATAVARAPADGYTLVPGIAVAVRRSSSARGCLL